MHKNANNQEIERMLRDMNRLMQDSAFFNSVSDESRWFALNQLESFLNESNAKMSDRRAEGVEDTPQVEADVKEVARDKI